jgi:type IV pilus assembly protein PilA
LGFSTRSGETSSFPSRQRGDQRMFKRMKNQQGFTLIELMIVVAIIGILAAVAIPNFLKYQAKSKQSEARVLLSGLYTSEIAYFAEQNQYGDWAADYTGAGISANDIGFEPASTPKYYKNISTVGAGTANFVTTATGNIDGDATIDTWTVSDASREPNNTINDVTS